MLPASLGFWWWWGRAEQAAPPAPAAAQLRVPLVKTPGFGAATPPGPGGDRAAGAAPAAPAPMPGSPDAGADADLHPHPITPAHLRIQRENNLIGSLNGAMDVGDAVGLRGLLDQYRSEFPDDPNLLQQGYGIIADCLQYPGAATKAAGQSYYDRERGSILRRFVARHCQLP